MRYDCGVPSFAGYRDLRDYLTQRCQRDGTSLSAVSLELGFARIYLPNVALDLFTPSADRCRKIAKHFGDDATLVLVLAGHADPPSDRADRFVAEVVALAASVPRGRRAEVIATLRGLADAGKRKRKRQKV